MTRQEFSDLKPGDLFRPSTEFESSIIWKVVKRITERNGLIAVATRHDDGEFLFFPSDAGDIQPLAL